MDEFVARLQAACKCCTPKPPAEPPGDEPAKDDPFVSATKDTEESLASAEPEPKPEPEPEPPAAPTEPVPPSADEIAGMTPALILRLMQGRQHISDPTVMELCCKQLRVLCRQDGVCQECDSLGAAAHIVEAMNAHPGDPSVQQQGCAALINLCAGESFARRDHAADAGALDTVIAAMTTHVEIAGIQEMACVALQNICFGGDSNGSYRKEVAVEKGALTALVQALNTHVQNMSVYEQATATLRLITAKKQILKARALEAGAKNEWLKSSGSVTSRIGGMTSRMFGASSRKLNREG